MSNANWKTALIASAFCMSALTTTAYATDYQFIGQPVPISFNAPSDYELAVGQIIRLQTTQTLDSWTFLVLGGGSGNIALHVAEWDGYEPLAPLYSQVIHYAGGQTFLTFDGINTTLSAFDAPDYKNYLIYLSVEGVTDPVSNITLMKGNFISADGLTPVATTSETRMQVGPASFQNVWYPTPTNGSPSLFAFEASFSDPVPEPNGAALLVVGLTLMGAGMRHRQRRSSRASPRPLVQRGA